MRFANPAPDGMWREVGRMALGVTAEQCKIGRAALGLSPDDLAIEANVPAAVITALENGQLVPAAEAIKLADALAKAGVTFFRAPDGSDRMRARTLDGIIEAPVSIAKS